MRLASRLFLLSADDTLHMLASAAFMCMLRQEDVARVPDFAGQRTRQASIVVEVVDSTPRRMVPCTFSILEFGPDGLLDVERLNSQQFARMGDPLGTYTTGAGDTLPGSRCSRAVHRPRRIVGTRAPPPAPNRGGGPGASEMSAGPHRSLSF